MTDMLGQLRDLQRKLEEAREALGQETVEASAGRGAVRVVMSGTQECREIHLRPDLLNQGDAAQLEGLLILAINQALRDSQLLAARRLGPLAGPLAAPTTGK